VAGPDTCSQFGPLSPSRPSPGGVDETDVALDRVGADTVDAHAAAARQWRAQRDEIAGRGRIGLDMQIARARLQAAARGNREPLPALARTCTPKRASRFSVISM
jgi:hypothetical protein